MTEPQRIYLEERWQALIARNACASGAEVSWDDCLRYVDEAFWELEVRMHIDYEHAVFWQQQMAVMLLRKQEIVAIKSRSKEGKG